MNNEPAKTIGWVVGILTALIDGVIVFGVPLDPDQKAYLVGLSGLVAPVVAGYLIREEVFGPETVNWITATSMAAQQRKEMVKRREVEIS